MTTPTPGISPGSSPSVRLKRLAGAEQTAQTALAGEHACIYGYGVLGAHLDIDAQEPALDALDVHRERRNALEAEIRKLDADPAVAQAAYALPFEVTDAASARKLGAELENRLTQVYADVVASAADNPGLRKVAIRGLVDAGAMAARWSGRSSAFPGLDDRPGAPIVPRP